MANWWFSWGRGPESGEGRVTCRLIYLFCYIWVRYPLIREQPSKQFWWTLILSLVGALFGVIKQEHHGVGLTLFTISTELERYWIRSMWGGKFSLSLLNAREIFSRFTWVIFSSVLCSWSNLFIPIVLVWNHFLGR